MKITKIELIPIELELKEPYTIAYETISKAPNVFCKIFTDENIIGIGVAAPDLEVTGESISSVIKVVADFMEPAILGQDPLRHIKILSELKAHLKLNPSAIAMLDMALFDILGKKANLPLYKILGGYREKIITSITIGILPISETLKRANEYVKSGFKAIKLKGGINVEEDVEKLRKIREKIGEEIFLRFDANQGYTVEQSLYLVEKTKSVKLELFEQPTPRKELQLLGQVTSSVHVPVMADESIMSIKDVFKLAKNDLVDTVNIKLMKVGGIAEALHINSVAKAANLEVMVGCMDEAELGIAAGLHFALARPNVDYADLDGHFDLLNDPSKGTIILEDGFLIPSGKPGLGLDASDLNL
ncbi:MAG: dipeptide epimerase [Bacteroidetes bacterium]|nr:dipeptide epimerase [Bacteroidota bacterium]MBU1679708.1 dipeptide epimerase [Bacteroidota bacterium]MBU2507201.1 dipeptide epimerase [Bacteroidota bacterium]